MIETIFMGRLGNNLFQYAVARTVAERSGYNFHIITDSHKWGVFSNLFNVSMGVRDGDKSNLYGINGMNYVANLLRGLGYELTKEPRDIIATKVKKDVKQ